jgi:muramoyltetrapeptide carboxypeptidase LdcA involved in peptidoglycan recycling
VTSPSSGVDHPLRARLDFCVQKLRDKGFDVVVGECMDGAGVVSAPAAERAHELTAMLTDPSIAAVVPPWGGELAIEVLPLLDFERIASAEPTWLVGYSDLTTVMFPLTMLTEWATLHGANLMETPYAAAPGHVAWWEIAGRSEGEAFTQRAATAYRSSGHDDWEGHPTVTERTLDRRGSWSLLDPSAGHVDVTGRLIGGCIDVLAHLHGTPYGDLPSYGAAQGDDGLLVYLEATEQNALDIARALHGMRLAGWFEHARAVLVGRTSAPDSPGYTQRDAVVDALGGLGIPVVLDVECGHVPPQMPFVNGSLARVVVDGARQEVTQRLV